jgi:hypothetical protein
MQLHRPSRREWQNLHLAMIAAVVVAAVLVGAVRWLIG